MAAVTAVAALELEAVTFRHPGSDRAALDELTLRVEAGEVVGVVGANDAGKSTLCLVAAGLAPGATGGHLAGEVRLAGEPIGGRRPHELAGRAGLVFQDPAAQRSGVAATVFEEVAIGPVNLGWPVADSVGAVRAALGALGIEHLAERHPARLSGGQATLVAIASALAMGPGLLVLDEPTASLDPEATELVVVALRRLATAGRAIVIAEHRTDVLARIAGRVVALRQGRAALEGPAQEVLADARLAELGVRQVAESAA